MLDNNVQNPPITNLQRRVVHVSLVFDGIDFDPDDIYDALDAEYPVVAYEKNQAARGCFIFNLSAT
jgi:hypothetical protein